MKTVALISHDERKKDMIEWVLFNQQTLKNYELVGTSTTARLIELVTKIIGPESSEAEIENVLTIIETGSDSKDGIEKLEKKLAKMEKPNEGLKVEGKGSGPLGGDLRIAVDVLDGKIDCIIFLIDVMSSHAHKVDIDSLIRTCVLHKTPLALNRRTADLCLMGMTSGE